jgi:hypothetical protein
MELGGYNEPLSNGKKLKKLSLWWDRNKLSRCVFNRKLEETINVRIVVHFPVVNV